MPKPTFLQSVLGRPSRSYAAERGAPTSPPTWDGPSPTRSSFSAGSVVAAPRRASNIPSAQHQHQHPRSSTSDIGTSTYYPRRPSLQAYAEYDDYAEYAASGSSRAPPPPQPHQPPQRPADAVYTLDAVRRRSQAIGRSQSVVAHPLSSRGLLSGDTLYDDGGFGGLPPARSVQIAIPRGGLDDGELGDDDDDDADGHGGYVYQDPAEYNSRPSARAVSYSRSQREAELRPPKLTPPGSTTSSETPPSVSSTLYTTVSVYDPPYSSASEQQAASKRKSSVDSSTSRRNSLDAVPAKALPAPPPAPKPRPETVYYDFDSDSEADDDDGFFTPRTSLDVIDEHSEEDTPAAQILQLPVVQLQPPTPAPTVDPGATPFHADDQPGSESEGYLSPDVDRRRAPPVDDEPDDEPDESESEEMASVVVAERVLLAPKAPTPAHMAPTVSTLQPSQKQQKQHRSPIQVPPPLPPKGSPDRGGRVRHAHMTVLNEVPIKIERKSDGLTRSKSTKSVKSKSKSIRSSSSSDYGPPELPRKTRSEDGRPALPSWVTEQPPPLPQSLSRASTAMARPMSRPSTSMSDRTEPDTHERRVSADSANTGSDIGRSVDGGVRTAGYGKGGWAAASAAPLVMYMPSGGDGWAMFQPLPPRSRYNPLPGTHGSSERGTDSRGGSSWSGSLGLGSAPTSADGRGSLQLSRNSVTSSRTASSNEDFGRRASVASALRAGMTPPRTPPLQAAAAAAADSDSESDYERPSRSYAPYAKVAPPTPAAPPPRVPSEELVRGSLSFDYASEASHGDHGLAVHASPAKYDGAGRHRSWIAEGYDPYTDARAASSDLSRSNTMASARQSMPPLPRRAPESVNSAPSTISSRHSYMPPSAIHSPPPSDGGRTPRLPVIQRQLPLDPIREGALRPMSPDSGSLSPYDVAARAHAGRVGLDRPSSLNPDMLTFLPTMTEQDSNRLYAASEAGPPRRAKSVKSLVRYAMSDGGDAHTPRESLSRSASRRQSMPRPQSRASAYSDAPTIRKATSTGRIQLDSMFDNTNAGSAPLMESHGRDQRFNGYTNLVLPTGGAYKPSANPVNELSKLNARALGMPQSSLAAITFSSSLFNLEDKGAPTPAHLRGQLPPPVDFTSHSRPPTKVQASQVMVQVYAVAIDQLDIDALSDLKRSAVGKYIPGRSFVGRVQAVGDSEKDLVRGDIVIGLQDIRKSGALCEYILVDRRRVGRVPPSTTASLEQLAALPLQGIACVRALRGVVTRNTRALIMDADTGIPALMCQEMARMGVSVVAIIPGGEGSGAAQAACMANGAKGVHIGSPAAIMLGLEEAVCDIVVDTRGGKKVTDAARRVLVDGGRVISLVPPDVASSPETATRALPPKRSKSLKNLRASFVGGRRKEHGHNAVFEYIHAAGAGEPEVDASGLDVRDVLEEPLLALFRPAVEKVVPFERGAAVFRPRVGVSAAAGCVAVVRLVN